MPSYTDIEKEGIARDFLLPRVRRECGLSAEELVIEESLWPYIIRPLGFDSGIRSLKRILEGIARKTAKAIVEEKVKKVIITKENLKTYISGYI